MGEKKDDGSQGINYQENEIRERPPVLRILPHKKKTPLDPMKAPVRGNTSALQSP